MIIDLFSERDTNIIKTKFEQAKEMQNVIFLTKKEVDETDFNSLHFNWRIKEKTKIGAGKFEIIYFNTFDEIDITLPYEFASFEMAENSFEDFDLDDDDSDGFDIITPIEIEHKYPAGFKSYLGIRKLKTQKKTVKQVQNAIDVINKKWDCSESESIQKWYYENNSEYKEQIINAKKNENICFYEVITSDMDIEAIKKELSQKNYTNSGSTIPSLKPKILQDFASYDESFEHANALYEESKQFDNDEEYPHYNRKEHIYKLSEDQEFEIREQYDEEGRLNAQYQTDKDNFERDSAGNYDDHRYFQRIVEDDE